MRNLAILALGLLATLLFADAAEARGRRHRARQSCNAGCATLAVGAAPTTAASTVAAGADALGQVNALRSARGLPPYVACPGLQEAALACATYRARLGIRGHCSNDFLFLPAGYSAEAAGCAAWPAGSGWGACCTFDSYRFAGAAQVIGPDGLSYNHIYVRR